MRYQMLYDLARPLCFVGDTWHNHMQYAYWKDHRDCEMRSLEYVLTQSQLWWNQRQFMCAVTNVAFKKQVTDAVLCFSPAWFSIVNETSMLGSAVQIGRNSLINNFNVIYDDTVIGDHVTITNFCQLSHDVKISDMCMLSPYSYLCFTHLAQGVALGMRSTIPGKPDNLISICSWTNILMDSRITKSIDQLGTWYGNRKIDNQGSLSKKIL